MKLNRFIDEIKHNSTGLYIVLDNEGEDQEDVYCGTKGTIIHNVNYLNKYQSYEIKEINPLEDEGNFATFEIVIKGGKEND